MSERATWPAEFHIAINHDGLVAGVMKRIGMGRYLTPRSLLSMFIDASRIDLVK